MPELEIQRFDIIDSTSTEAVRLAESGARHGTVLVADEQTGGRGRAGRVFCSPPGGLYFSVIMRPGLQTGLLPLVTLAVGCAVRSILCRVTGLDTLLLKWPNDIYAGSAKVAGILTESGPFSGLQGPDYVVCGVGINLNTDIYRFPAALQATVTSLSHITGIEYDADDLLVQIVRMMLVHVDRLVSDPHRLLADWRKADYLFGKPLNFTRDEMIIPGTGAGLAEDGRYTVLDRSGNLHYILAGDLHPLDLD